MTARWAATAAAAVVAVVSVGACSSPPARVVPGPPPVSASTSAGQEPRGVAGPRGGVPGAVNVRDARAVAAVAAVTAYRYDVRTDRSPADALARAGRWLTPAYAAQATAARSAVGSANGSGGGQPWLELAGHDGWTSTSVRVGVDDGAAPDDATHASRQVVVTVTSHGGGDWVAPPPQVATVYVELTRATRAEGWQVAQLTAR